MQQVRMLHEENVINFEQANLQAEAPCIDDQLVNEIASLHLRLRMLEELNSWLQQDSNNACAALHGEDVEVAMLYHPSAQPFALSPYPVHLDNPSICPICQLAFDAITKFYTLPCRHRFHIICLLKALRASHSCTLSRAEILQALHMILGLRDVYPRP